MNLDWIGPHRLTDENVTKYVSAEPGVYRLSVEQTNGEKRIVYVGQSKNLEDRQNQYLNYETKNECLLNHLKNHNCYFKVARVDYADDRDGAERALYDHFKGPECNDKDRIPDVQPLDMNFN